MPAQREPIAPPRRLPLRREIAAATLGWSALAVAMTWPALLHPASTVPEDLGDPLLQVWEAAWGGHALLHQPAHVFDANVFWPLHGSLAFTDSLLGYAPAGLIGSGAAAALVRYNLLYVFSFALCSIGAYLLGRQLGLRPMAAGIVGIVYAYAPWRIAQSGHLHILSAGGIPLALAFLARGHGVGRRVRLERARPAYAFIGWLVAAWQVTIGFGLGLPFAYLLAAICVVAFVGWLVAGRPPVPSRLLSADLTGAGLFLLVGLAMAAPYLQVARDHPEARRTAADIALFSPPLRGFFIVPAQERLWGSLEASASGGLSFPPEMTLAAGYFALLFAVLGVAVARCWTPWRRGVLAVVVIGSVLFGLGTSLAGGRFTYLVLLDHAPGWAGIRTPGRLVVFASLAIGLLAAAAADTLAPRVRGLPMLVAALALAEGLSTIPHPRPGPVPAVFRHVKPPILVLPSDDFTDGYAMYWSTDGFPAIANGSSGFTPAEQADLRAHTADFPSTAAIQYLRRFGIRTVVLLHSGRPPIAIPIQP